MKDDKILQRMGRGDAAALEMLMDKYIPYVSAIVWNILREQMTREDAEELVSDVFVSAWQQAADIRPDATKAWLGAVARNKAKNALRRVKKELPLEEDLLEVPDEFTPASAVERAEEQRLVQEALETLEEPDREIFLRHYYYVQSISEISEAIELNPSTIKTKLRRGRLRLKEILIRSGVR